MNTTSPIKLDFIGIGAAKAGTTWLAQCLAEHPQIAMSRPKELNYFGDYRFFNEIGSNFGESEAWLAARFAHGRPGQLRGEFSVSYLPDLAVPARLFSHNPAMKIIVSYREPVARLYSFYHQLLKEYPVPSTFEGLLASSPMYIENGFYARQTAAVLAVFPRKQVHFLRFDDLARDPAAVLRSVHSFLRVDPEFIPPSLNEKVNERRKPRSLAMRNGINRVRVVLNSSAAARAVRRIMVSLGGESLMHWLLEANLVESPLEPMNPATRKRLQAIYAPEVRALQEITGLDLRGWLETYAKE
jgi:hypothetical protein